jgi:hypothetical protein
MNEQEIRAAALAVAAQLKQTDLHTLVANAERLVGWITTGQLPSRTN